MGVNLGQLEVGHYAAGGVRPVRKHAAEKQMPDSTDSFDIYFRGLNELFRDPELGPAREFFAFLGGRNHEWTARLLLNGQGLGFESVVSCSYHPHPNRKHLDGMLLRVSYPSFDDEPEKNSEIILRPERFLTFWRSVNELRFRAYGESSPVARQLFADEGLAFMPQEAGPDEDEAVRTWWRCLAMRKEYLQERIGPVVPKAVHGFFLELREAEFPGFVEKLLGRQMYECGFQSWDFPKPDSETWAVLRETYPGQKRDTYYSFNRADFYKLLLLLVHGYLVRRPEKTEQMERILGQYGLQVWRPTEF